LGLSLVGVDLDLESGELCAESGGLKEYFVVGRLNGPVSRLIGSLGFLKAMAGVHGDRRFFSDAASLFVADVEKAARFARERGFAGLAIADDIAGSDGLFFSPEYFAGTVWPLYRQAAQTARRMGLRTFFHSDGDTRKVIDLLIKAGYDCIHPVDAAAGLNVFDLAKEFGRRVCFMGHIDIMGWTEEKIRAEIGAAEEAFRKGGLILGASCGISATTAAGRLDALYPGPGGRR